MLPLPSACGLLPVGQQHIAFGDVKPERAWGEVEPWEEGIPGLPLYEQPFVAQKLQVPHMTQINSLVQN